LLAGVDLRPGDIPIGFAETAAEDDGGSQDGGAQEGAQDDDGSAALGAGHGRVP
jgi:hypothetical protein